MHWPSILLYMASSFMIVIFNKIVLSVFSFTSVPFIMFCQSVFTLMFIFARCVKIQKPNKDIALLCMFNCANIFFGINAARALNVAMFSALRRVSILTTLLAQSLFFKEPINSNILSAVLFMLFGSFVAAWDDLSFDAWGYTLVMITNVFTTASQIQTKITMTGKWTKMDVLFWSSSLTMILSFIKLLQFDPSTFSAWNQTSFQIALGFSIVLGVCINYGATWTIEKNDALTLSVAGTTKSAIMGLVVCAGLFDQSYIFSWWNFVGLQISTVGSFVYVLVKHQGKNNKENSTISVIRPPDNKTSTIISKV